MQARLIPIADRHNGYAYRVRDELKEAGLRVEVDDSADRMQAKIRQAQLERIPYMLVVGDREAAEGVVSLRLRTEEDLGARPVADFVKMVQEAIAEKRDL